MGTILQKILLLIALTVFLGTIVYAEENRNIQVDEILNDFNYDKKIASQQIPTTQGDTEYTQTSAERMMLIKANILNVQIVAFLYAFALVIIIILMWRTTHQAKDIVTIVGLVSVIFATLLLVLMIANTETMTAPIGIFGAIAGYLFGAVQKKEDPKEEPKKENPKEAI